MLSSIKRVIKEFKSIPKEHRKETFKTFIWPNEEKKKNIEMYFYIIIDLLFFGTCFLPVQSRFDLIFRNIVAGYYILRLVIHIMVMPISQALKYRIAVQNELYQKKIQETIQKLTNQKLEELAAKAQVEKVNNNPISIIAAHIKIDQLKPKTSYNTNIIQNALHNFEIPPDKVE